MDIHTYVKVKLLLSPRQSRGFTCFNYALLSGDCQKFAGSRQQASILSNWLGDHLIDLNEISALTQSSNNINMLGGNDLLNPNFLSTMPSDVYRTKAKSQSLEAFPGQLYPAAITLPLDCSTTPVA